MGSTKYVFTFLFSHLFLFVILLYLSKVLWRAVPKNMFC
jgi:hypothetical protein